MSRKPLLLTSLCCILLFTPRIALADVGLPMIFLVWPASWVLFVPVVLIEALVAHRMLALRAGRSLGLATLANAASTLVGVPLTWLILVVPEVLLDGGGKAHGVTTWSGKFVSAILQAAWLVPYEEDFYWMLPAACIALCIPFFFASVLIESLVGRLVVRGRASELRRWSWVANSLSYAAIEFGLVGWLVVSVLCHR